MSGRDDREAAVLRGIFEPFCLRTLPIIGLKEYAKGGAAAGISQKTRLWEGSLEIMAFLVSSMRTAL